GSKMLAAPSARWTNTTSFSLSSTCRIGLKVDSIIVENSVPGRHFNPKAAARARTGIHSRRPVHLIHRLAYDCQANARPHGSAAEAFEQPKYTFVVLRRDA